ncbi:MAG: hypothetical protein GVY06_10035 [Alphaproteobacteria bacterium]|nr:hypothetical protein [Alphaproteobacteria bacterium]
MTDRLEIAGRLSQKDVKRLARLTRASTVGPTATYYAGVTAPVITAGVAIMSKSAFQSAGVPAYWVYMLSALLAAMTGVVWYLIFMRWSYRHTYGRGVELTDETAIALEDQGLSISRGHVETRIGWPAVRKVLQRRGYTAILAEGADAIVIPDRWFGKDRQLRARFRAGLDQYMTGGD